MIKNFLSQFQAASSINERWQVCQQYHGEVWTLRKSGIRASYESDRGHFWVTDIELEGYGRIGVASEDIPSSNAFGYTDIKVEPPRTLEDLHDCGCPLFCYEN